MPHHITKVSLQLNAAKGMDGFVLQQELSQWFWQEFTPLLEAAFDQAIPPDVLVRLDKLELEIPALDPKHWRAQLTAALLAALENALNQALPQTAVASTANGADKATQVPIAQHHFESWLYFLQNGRLPVDSASAPEIERLDAVLQSVSAETSAVRSLLELLRQSPNALERLVYQHKPAFLATLLSAVCGQNAEAVPTWPAACFRFLDSASKLAAAPAAGKNAQPNTGLQAPSLPAERQFERRFWVDLFNEVAHAPQSFHLPRFIDTFFKQAFEIYVAQVFRQNLHRTDLKYTMGQLQQFAKKQPPAPDPLGLRQAFQAAIEGLVAAIKQATVTPLPARNTPARSSAAEAAASQPVIAGPSYSPADAERPDGHVLPDTDLDKTTRVPKANVKDPVSEPAGGLSHLSQQAITGQPEPSEFYIQNAGMVLLHPFFAPLFEATGITKGGKFEASDAPDRAVQLLQYLVSGNTEPPEYTLILPKILCGLPSNLPMERRNLLDASVLAEAEVLLSEVIKHWGVLGQVSNESLREGFLKREGKLSRQSGGNWLLQMENQTIDILLKKLPWGISIVKLDWMKEMLFVEWG